MLQGCAILAASLPATTGHLSERRPKKSSLAGLHVHFTCSLPPFRVCSAFQRAVGAACRF